MQGSFITHHNEQHPKDCFKCEFCDSYFETSNRLFKHQRSHLYMKYKCNECDKLFQFSYQIRNHLTQHTGVGKHLCSIYPKTFRSKCSKDFHKKTHNVRIKCDLCLMSTSKEFNSMVALHIHQCGMHGPGWTALCSKNYKWKSQYTRHSKSDCKVCSEKKVDIKLLRYKFLNKVDLTKWNVNCICSAQNVQGHLPYTFVLKMDVTQGNVTISSILESPCCVNCAFSIDLVFCTSNQKRTFICS